MDMTQLERGARRIQESKRNADSLHLHARQPSSSACDDTILYVRRWYHAFLSPGASDWIRFWIASRPVGSPYPGEYSTADYVDASVVSWADVVDASTRGKWSVSMETRWTGFLRK